MEERDDGGGGSEERHIQINKERRSENREENQGEV